ncbi:hypothetical protein Chor_017292 [Crotalus horridus]
MRTSKKWRRKWTSPARLLRKSWLRTTEYLQPNPASRAKLTMLNTVSKIRGQVKNPGYPQSEGLLGESMMRYGKELGDDSNFGDALLDAGESMKRLAEVKDSLDIEVKQNFIDPLQNLCDKDLKEIQHHLRKLEGRRLDFDYKKKRQGKIPDEELRQALEKFEESKEVAETTSSSFRSEKPSRTPSRIFSPHLDQPCCKALYDFEPENDGELGFREGDIITLTNQIDENWYEGMINGLSGFFPLNYVEVLVPLPQ